MYEAVELRQLLLNDAIEKKNEIIIANIPKIKQKALLTNLLISRDMEALKSTMDQSAGDLLLLKEHISSQSIYNDFQKYTNLLEEAINSKNIIEIENTIAYMSYHYFYIDSIDDAILVLSELTKNPYHLIKQLVEGLQNNNLKIIEEGVEYANMMGLVHDAIDISLCENIIKEKEKVISVSILKYRLYKPFKYIILIG